MKKRLAAVAVLLLAIFVVSAWATVQTHNTLPTSSSTFLTDLQTYLRDEDAQRFVDQFANFVVSGGVIATGAGLTNTPTALTAYAGGYYVTETGSITFSDNAACWIIADQDTTGNVTTFTRVGSTHYLLDCASVGQPAQPSRSVYIGKMTTAGGSRTVATDLRPLTPVSVAKGGTGLASYTIGDLLYASATTTLAKLADVADGNVLRSGGVGVAPLYGKVRISGATTDITGTLGVGSGGTGVTTTPANGQIPIGDGTGYVVANLTGGSGITVTNAAGSVTISQTSGSQIPGGRNFSFAFASTSVITLGRKVLNQGTLGVAIEVGGSILTSTSDVTLTIPTSLVAATTLTGGSTFATTLGSAIVTAAGSAFTTELVKGDTVVVDLAGTPYAFTVKTIDSATQFTAFQAATATVNTKTGTRSGVTAASRVTNALYFAYVPSTGWANAFLDTAMPVNGYHPRTTTARWTGIQVWNGAANVLDNTWTWANGVTSLSLKGTQAGNYTGTNAAYALVDSTNLGRFLFVPAGGVVRAHTSFTLAGTAANQIQNETITRDLTAIDSPTCFTGNTFGVGVAIIGSCKLRDQPTAGIYTYGLAAKIAGAATFIMHNTTGAATQWAPQLELVVEE